MAHTYNSANISALGRDWIRFTLGQTVEDTSLPSLTDEEIDEMLAIEANAQLAAWRLGQGLLTRYMAKAKGIDSKAVDDLRISYGGGSGQLGRFRDMLTQLLHEGRRLETPSPKLFRTVQRLT